MSEAARDYFRQYGYSDANYQIYMWQDNSTNPPGQYRILAPYELMKNSPFKGVYSAGYLVRLGYIDGPDEYPLLPDERLSAVLPITGDLVLKTKLN
jgi:hypothetical protein